MKKNITSSLGGYRLFSLLRLIGCPLHPYWKIRIPLNLVLLTFLNKWIDYRIIHNRKKIVVFTLKQSELFKGILILLCEKSVAISRFKKPNIVFQWHKKASYVPEKCQCKSSFSHKYISENQSTFQFKKTSLFRSSQFSFLFFGNFWRQSYKKMKISCNLCLHFAR